MQGDDGGLSKADDSKWNLPIGALILSGRHIGLSGWQQAECMAIENELGSWQQAGQLSEHLPALRYVPVADCVIYALRLPC